VPLAWTALACSYFLSLSSFSTTISPYIAPLHPSTPNMSFSVDDLVSSLSSSHIGQEALDLAALQVSHSLPLSRSNAGAKHKGS
jgi:hypothetical protein